MLLAQVIGSAIITVSTFAVAMAVMYVVHIMGVLRVTEEGERFGAGSARAWHFGLSGIPDQFSRAAHWNSA